MPINEGLGNSGGGGGSGIIFRKPPDSFKGANLAAARVARNSHFSAQSNAADLLEFQSNQFLAIILTVTGSTDNTFETYTGSPSDAYDATKWVERTDAIQGIQGDNAAATPLSDDAPAPPGVAAAGTGIEASRDDHAHSLPPEATNVVAGLMPAADKAKLGGIASGAEVNIYNGAFLFGAGIPKVSAGVNKDSYVDTVTGNFYQKTGGAWVLKFKATIVPVILATKKYTAISEDIIFTEAEILAGETTTGFDLTVPTYSSVRRYIGIAVPDSDADISSIRSTSNIEAIHTFVRIPGTVNVSGAAYKIWRTNCCSK